MTTETVHPSVSIDVSGEEMTAVEKPVAPRPVGTARRNWLTSVIVCTIGRSPGLQDTLNSLLSQDWPDLEIVLVDNAPGRGNTVAVAGELGDPRVRYASESRPGLSRARNRGAALARGSVVMFTDDDCTAQVGWIRAVRDVLDQNPAVSCVTGRTIPNGEMNAAQQFFEDFGSFNRGELRTVWGFTDRSGANEPPAEIARLGMVGKTSRIYPYSGVFGSGNNMAFTAAALRELGPFDEALGAGSPAGGGEDLDMFIRLVLAGHVLVYEPAAVIRHTHRQDVHQLATQVRAYGSGLSAMLTKHLLSDPASRARILRRVLPGLRHLLSASSAKNRRKTVGYPRHLTWLELRGVVEGPWLYFLSRRDVARASHAGSSEPMSEPMIENGRSG